MSSFAADNSGTEAAREGFRFDEAALDRWMRQSVGDYHGTLRVEQFRGGQSNPTFKLITSLRNYVLRRKPPGPAGRLAADRYSVG
nr:hypothetical protein [uncultured Lichenicoccus sp.]